MGDRSSERDREIQALRRGIELGMNHIDTAESYASGRSEEVVGDVVKGIREKAFIATKVSGGNLRYDDVIKAATGSLRRLGIDCIDLYQVHWPNPGVPIRDTMKAMEHLVETGRVRYIGVSNFSVEELQEARAVLSRHEIVSNQVEYSLVDRGIERDLLPYCQREGITVIAYSPLAGGKIADRRGLQVLSTIAEAVGRTLAQVTLNWVIAHEGVVAIPKASSTRHVEENAGAAGWRLDQGSVKLLDSL